MDRRRPVGRRPVWVLVGSVTTMTLIAVLTGVRHSPLVPILPHGAGPLAPIRWMAKTLRLGTLSPSALVAVAGVAIALAGAAFLLALREAWRGSLPLSWILVAGAAFHALAVAVPLFNSRDVYQYAMQGRIAAFHGANPYVATPSDFRSDPLFAYIEPKWRNSPAFYGPASIELSERVVRSAHRLPDVVLVFKLMAAVASLATIGIVALLVRRLAPIRAAFATALFALNPVVIYSGVAGGHNDLFVALAEALALWLVVLARARHQSRLGLELLATGVMTAGAMVKAPAVIPLVLLIVASVADSPARQRARALLGHAVIVGGLVFAFVRPFEQAHDPTLGMRRAATFSSYLAPSNFFRELLERLLNGPDNSGWTGVVITLVRLAFPLAFVAVLLLAVRSLLRSPDDSGPLRHAAAWGSALLVFTLSAPMFFPWYLVWTLPLAWALPKGLRGAVIFLSVVLPLFSIVTDPGPAPYHAYNLVLALGTAVAAPVFFVILVSSLRTLRDRWRAGLPMENEALIKQDGGERAAQAERAVRANTDR